MKCICQIWQWSYLRNLNCDYRNGRCNILFIAILRKSTMSNVLINVKYDEYGKCLICSRSLIIDGQCNFLLKASLGTTRAQQACAMSNPVSYSQNCFHTHQHEVKLLKTKNHTVNRQVLSSGEVFTKGLKKLKRSSFRFSVK